ncbi:alpha/beta hydrolase [Altererythrobacter sp. TH136]|uniref:alpha/beta hydrolase n=1 Tax=Altererythrobacter sp. TH136 TaxID=2067415 RepID=UPI001163823A|nr:alpha/beta hydrolase [Altererythrobacter sp. TH136]QDM40348.1 lysophospholipase [Altererythrobacter sp. TH136]
MKRTDWRLTGHGGVELFAQGWLPEGPVRDVIAIAHGFAEHGGRYGNLVERLVPHGYALYALDHRGHGRSGGKRALVDRMAWVIEDFHKFVSEVRARHGGQRIKLLGHSMGGNVAFGYALRWPEDLSGLILSGPLIGGSAPAGQRLIVKLLSAIAPGLGTVALPPEAVSRDPAVVKAYAADPLVTIGKVPARTAHELFAPLPGYLARAPGMKVPVLIQHGEADALVPLKGARPTIDAIGASDKTVITYPGLFHEIYNEPEKDAVIGDLTRWLEAHPAD